MDETHTMQVGIAAIQGGVISAVALYLGFRMPAIIREWNESRKVLQELVNSESAANRTFQAEEAQKLRDWMTHKDELDIQRHAERSASHREDLKFLAESVCKYKERP